MFVKIPNKILLTFFSLISQITEHKCETKYFHYGLQCLWVPLINFWHKNILYDFHAQPFLGVTIFLVNIVQAGGGGVMEWGMFSWHTNLHQLQDAILSI